MIVDFSQDPEMPFGTGNFRDDKGREMYLHDPETAGQFVKTLKGARLAKRTAVADDGPPVTPGQAAAAAATGIRSDVEGLERAVEAEAAEPAPKPPGAPQAPAGAPGAPAGAPGAAAGAGIDATNAAVAGLEQAVTGGAAQQQAQAAITDLDATKASLAAPTPAPGAPPAAGPPSAAQQQAQAAVDQLDSLRDPRTVGPTRATIAPRSTLGLPPASVGDSESYTEAEGRPIENVLADDREIRAAQDVSDAQMLENAREADRQVQATYGRLRDNTATEYGRHVERFYESKRRQAEAEAQERLLKQQLEENEKKLDPDRYMREMPTGKRIGMIILAALNGGFGAIIGAKNNDVLDTVNAEIERDIDRQKREIETGRVSISNDIAKYQRLGLDARQAEDLARDRADAAMLKFLDLEAKRVGAVGEQERATRLALAPKVEERAVRRSALLAQAETKRQRAIDARTVYAVPPVVPGAVMSPQDQLANETLEDRRIQRENAAVVGDIVGHPVSIDEAKEIRNDAQDLGKRLATGSSARQYLDQLRRDIGLRKNPETGKWEGDADPGSRPFGISATDRSKLIDTGYATLKRADIMGMVREPSAALQNEFAKITERPFFDSQIAQQLDAYERVIAMAEKEARRGFSDDVIAYYDRKRTPVARNGRSGRPAQQQRSAAPAPAPAPAPAAPAPPPAAPAAPQQQQRAPGGLRFE